MTVRRKRQDCAIDVRPPLPANAFAWQLRTAAGEIAINGRSSKSLMCKRMFRVQVSAVNPTDWKSRSGSTSAAMQFPFVVPHQDGAGTIDAVGAGVDPGRVGRRVWLYMCSWQRQFGSAAQWICLPSEQAVDLPDEDLVATIRQLLERAS